MQAADSGEAEMETESPGGISETFHLSLNLCLRLCKPMFSFLEFILSLLPRPSAQIALTNQEIHWSFLSHSVYLVCFLCMVNVFPAPLQ